MTSNQANKYSMYAATLELLKDNADKTAATAAFAASFARLDSLVTQVLDKDKERMGKTPGRVAAKDEAEDALITATMIVSSALTAFARIKGNVQLKEKAHVSEGYLRHARSNEQINIAKLTYDLAKSNEEGLADFAITPTMLEGLKSRAEAYDAALKDVASGTAERVGVRTTVSELFTQVDDVLKEEIDPMMQIFRVTDPEFYNQFRAARAIKDIGVRHAKAAQTAEAVPVPG